MTIVLGLLAALAPFIPIVMEIAGFLIKMFGASKENLQQYQDMIQKNKDAGLVTVENYQRLSDWHQQMIDAANAKADEAKKLADVHQQELDKLKAANPDATPKT